VSTGSLTVVGTGIRLGQLSTESRGCIEAADRLLFLVCDAVTYSWLAEVNSNAESLHTFYSADKARETTYAHMVERILSYVRDGKSVCVALYGHPGVFAYPGHEAIRRARQEGYSARMLPAVSAEDCLFADLGIDPGTSGCQSFEATNFLVFRRRFDPSVPLILWQVGLTGEPGYRSTCNRSGLHILVDYLLQHYDKAHEVILYEASRYIGCESVATRVALDGLREAAVTVSSTLYIPPSRRGTPDLALASRLGIPASYFTRDSEPANGLFEETEPSST
jgi:uncharacterized protein YabN with tetrapyrrole methylase and pyrophosphatase domain